MLKTGRLNCVSLLTIPALLAGCGAALSDTSKAVVVQQLLEQAIENQVFVEGGTFILGDVGRPNGASYVTITDFSRPVVQVGVDSYSISRYETTWGEMRVYYEALDRLRLYKDSFTKKKYIKSTEDPLSPHYFRKPARVPNFDEAEGYCAWLAEQTGLPFALPTEAQWEYAARSRGKNVPYATDSGTIEKDPYLRRPKEYVDPSIPPSGNTLMHSSVKFERRPVGSYPPNSIGLYDMTGNVAEWTQDWFQEDFYEHASHDNPKGPAKPINPNKPEKTVRDWAGHGDHMGGGGTVFARNGENVSSGGHGFRCVVNQTKPVS
ncbi:SUMF1/EgtB/PvdO family nonheme iron enzyme [Marinobacter adhaerens]|uniref:SUMF1/EgtB/PvdO family nonheme iron enzyme n=1 Tax=Marinobacter adhaerens TaxID=1033846 RepID=A0A851HVY7_9GAMM|nr:SUMF1/EgtB/PvdO family nonheme iron enzyme [Marinobacter adhaerens]NWN91145.1 SUMF1/EgtB/PvdO family nonheme iron enzyme [Marinobacter adhaerens]